MKLARVVGNVTLSRCHPALESGSFRCVEIAMEIAAKNDDGNEDPLHSVALLPDTVIAWDLVGSRNGDAVAIAEGPEAAAPMRPQIVPVDAAIVALIDAID